jgi:hypothetical protein
LCEAQRNQFCWEFCSQRQNLTTFLPFALKIPKNFIVNCKIEALFCALLYKLETTSLFASLFTKLSSFFGQKIWKYMMMRKKKLQGWFKTHHLWSYKRSKEMLWACYFSLNCPFYLTYDLGMTRVWPIEGSLYWIWGLTFAQRKVATLMLSSSVKQLECIQDSQLCWWFGIAMFILGRYQSAKTFIEFLKQWPVTFICIRHTKNSLQFSSDFPPNLGT